MIYVAPLCIRLRYVPPLLPSKKFGLRLATPQIPAPPGDYAYGRHHLDLQVVPDAGRRWAVDWPHWLLSRALERCVALFAFCFARL